MNLFVWAMVRPCIFFLIVDYQSSCALGLCQERALRKRDAIVVIPSCLYNYPNVKEFGGNDPYLHFYEYVSE